MRSVNKISIITISFNSEDTISKTINSVKSQTYNQFEYLLIDGESKDETLTIAKKQNHITKIV